MSTQRSPFLADGEIGVDYRIERNPVFRAYEAAFRVMFEEFNGVPKAPHQANWYVGRRWDRRRRTFVPAGDAEGRLLKFVTAGMGSPPSPQRTLQLVFGRTGSGKTTFLRYFFGVYLPTQHKALADGVVPIIIDCAESALSADTLEADVDRRVHQCLNDDPKFKWLNEDPHYIRMWEEECDFDKLFYIRLWADMSPSETEKEKLRRIEPQRADFHNFNRIRINYLIKKGFTPVVVWDNLDQASLEVQRSAIQLARHKLSWMPGAKVIIAVREYTYPLVQQEIAPAAYLLSSQELFAPDVHSMLERRVDTSVGYLAGSTPAIKIEDRFSVILARPADFLRTVLASLKEKEVEEALCSLSADNVRLQLLMAKRTFRSGHIPNEMIVDMIESYSRGGNEVKLSWRRFLESLLCGDYQYHRETGDEPSLVLNVYESGEVSHEFSNSLCMPQILMILDRCEYETALSDVMSALRTTGHPVMSIRWGVERLMRCYLIQSPQGPLPPDFLSDKELPKPYMVSCTPVGRYYIGRLTKELVYIEHMALVTSLEESFRAKVHLWKPGELELGAESASALIAQVHKDELRERSAARQSYQAGRIYSEYGFGRLAHDMAVGCRSALERIKGAWKQRGADGTVDWQRMYDALVPPGILKLRMGPQSQPADV